MQRMPGGQSRWSQGKDLSWEPVRPELVARSCLRSHAGRSLPSPAQFRRWRSDKEPGDCTYAQFEVVPPHRARCIFSPATNDSRRLCAFAIRGWDRHPDRAFPADGRNSSGTCRRLTRIRVQVDERPRIESTSTSSTARSCCRFGYFALPSFESGQGRILLWESSRRR